MGLRRLRRKQALRNKQSFNTRLQAESKIRLKLIPMAAGGDPLAADFFVAGISATASQFTVSGARKDVCQERGCIASEQFGGWQ
jgi:hypothetical protein